MSCSYAQLTQCLLESLKRTIEAAHREHFQSASGMSSGKQQLEAPDSSVSLPDQPSKQRRTSLDGPSARSSADCSSKQRPLFTYGKSQFNSLFLEQLGDDPTGKQTGSPIDKPWSLHESIDEEWRHHEPMTMFPEASSTIPDATATQQLLLGEVLAPAFLGIEPEPDIVQYEPVKSSVPWSEYLKSSSKAPENRPDPTLQSMQPSGQEHSVASQDESGGPSIERNPAFPLDPHASQRSRCNSSLRLRQGPLRNEIVSASIYRKDEVVAPASLPEGTSPDSFLDGSAAARQRIIEKSLNSETITTELYHSPHQDQRIEREDAASSTSAGARQKFTAGSNSEDELAAIGLPQEQYKPRPTRSRSSKIEMEEPINYSVVPERAARKTRRSRTYGEIDNAPDLSTPQKIQLICDMGFTPSTTSKALSQNNGDVTHTVNWLIANAGGDDDELAPPRSSKTKRKRADDKQTVPQECPGTHNMASPPNDVSAMASGDPTINTEDGLPEISMNEPSMISAKSPRVKVVIPKPKGQLPSAKPEKSAQIGTMVPKHDAEDTPSRKAKRRKTALDQPDAPLDDPSVLAKEPPKQKKRRGRPRKETRSIDPPPEILDEGLPTERGDTEAILQEIAQNTSPPTETSSLEQTTGEAVDFPITTTEEHRAQPSRDTTPVLARKEAAQTPEKQPKELAGNCTPLSKGKVPYRVGLSKRARITPLLRIMKK